MKIETKIIDGETWTKVPPGYAVLPLEATSCMYMLGGNVPQTNLGKNGDRLGRRIGDKAAHAAWADMATVALKEMSR